MGSEGPTQQAEEATGSVRGRGVRDECADSEEGSGTGVVDVGGSDEEGRVNAHRGGTRSTPRQGETAGSEEEGANRGVWRSGGPTQDKREAVGEHADAPHTPRRSAEAEASSDEEHEMRKQHTESESGDGGDMERAPVSWERAVSRPAHEGRNRAL